MVRPEYQGQGIGRMLVNNVLDYIQSISSEEEPILVYLMSNVGKEEFYKKIGFTERPNHETGAGMFRWVPKRPSNWNRRL